MVLGKKVASFQDTHGFVSYPILKSFSRVSNEVMGCQPSWPCTRTIVKEQISEINQGSSKHVKEEEGTFPQSEIFRSSSVSRSVLSTRSEYFSVLPRNLNTKESATVQKFGTPIITKDLKRDPSLTLSSSGTLMWIPSVEISSSLEFFE